MDRIWKEVPGFEGEYVISSDGMFSEGKPTDPEAVLFNSSSQTHVTLDRCGITGRFAIIDILAAAFLGPRPPGTRLVNHHPESGRPHASSIEYMRPSDIGCPPRDDSMDEYEQYGWEPMVREHGAWDAGSANYNDYDGFYRE